MYLFIRDVNYLAHIHIGTQLLRKTWNNQ